MSQSRKSEQRDELAQDDTFQEAIIDSLVPLRSAWPNAHVIFSDSHLSTTIARRVLSELFLCRALSIDRVDRELLGSGELFSLHAIHDWSGLSGSARSDGPFTRTVALIEWLHRKGRWPDLPKRLALITSDASMTLLRLWRFVPQVKKV